MKVQLKLILSLYLLSNSFQSRAQELIYLCVSGNVNGWIDVWKYTNTSSNGGSSSKLTNNYSFQYWWVEPSPDNSKLLLVRTPVGQGINWTFNYDSCQVVILDMATNSETVIVDYDQYGWTSFGNPHWHPNGNRVIMYAKTNNNSFLYTINTDGTNPQQITNQYSLDPNWSKSGNKITFVGYGNSPTFPIDLNDHEVFVADYDFQTNMMSNITQLTNDTLRDLNPCFSPDDSEIVFSSGNDSLTFADIIRIDSNGANRTSFVSDGTTNIGPLNWGTNNKIYYHSGNLTANPYRAKVYDVFGNINANLFPPSSSGGITISPYYKYESLATVSELKKDFSELYIYPNPIINDVLHVELKSLKNNVDFAFFNVEGQIVLEGQISSLITNLDLSNLSIGAYVLQFKTERQIENRKIIKSW
ncbi:MAG: T9SS type A sorting domain-containing protein [Bacteroidota bacterium]